ncbi:MAG: 3'-5' exonuclease [Calditrichia bacterium]
MLERYRGLLEKSNAIEIAEKLVDEVGLKRIYEKTGQPEDEARLENVVELLNSIDIFVASHPGETGLENYLDEISLLTDIDRWDPDRPSVTLMTLHSAKGLEFPVVIIAGLEDGLFPLSRAAEDPDDLEEERRLFYVGITRARKKLYLLHAQSRHRFQSGDFGGGFRSIPSRFLKEIPEEYTRTSAPQGSGYRSYQERLRFKRMTARKMAANQQNNAPNNGSDFKIGQYVEHDVFGRGQILNVDVSNLGTKLTIQFSNRSIKKLIAEYANLKTSDKSESQS